MMITLLFACAPLFALCAPPLADEILPDASITILTVEDDEDEPDEEELTDKRPEIKVLLSTLAGHVKARGKEDEDAISVIDTLYQEFEKSGPKDRVAIVKELAKCFKARRKALADGVPDNRLHIACAVAFGGMGPESAKTLIGLIGHKDHRDDIDLQFKLILSLGKTKDESGVKKLQELLKHHLAQMQAAGAEALGYYRESDLKLRKEIFEELLKTVMRTKAKWDSDPTDLMARDRYETVRGPIITSLQLLTKVDEHDPDAWQRWWNKNKKKDWDEKED